MELIPSADCVASIAENFWSFYLHELMLVTFWWTSFSEFIPWVSTSPKVDKPPCLTWLPCHVQTSRALWAR